MFSVTEERLRTFVEKLSEALTNEIRVEVRPGDSWAAYPKRNPPLLTFRLSDVAVIKDEILSVTAHEIAHLIYTDPEVSFSFDTGKFPRAAHLLLNSVEDSRIERIFSDAFPGARSLFDQRVDQAYDGKVQRGFEELPIKWRYILNIDRVLHGLEPWGDDRDVNAVETVFDHVVAAMWCPSTQECADHLEFPFRVLVQLMKLERDEKGSNVPAHLDLPPELIEQIMEQRPADYVANAPKEDDDSASGDATDHAFDDGAGQDDHQQGGTDGTAGSRERARGQGQGQGQGVAAGIGVGAGAGKGAGAGNKDGGSGSQVGGDGSGSNMDWHGFGDPNDPGIGGSDDSSAGGGIVHDKATNIVEEMVAEERAKGNTNRTVDILSYRQRQRAQQSKEVERKIESEKQEFWEELNKLFGHDTSRSKRLAERLTRNQERYTRDATALNVEIRTLRGYARQILRDNQTDRYGGNHTSGLHVKKHRLYRMVNRDPRIFERKEEVGGKSYAICVVVDQSSSMKSGAKQQLAYLSSLVFLEAFEGLAETSIVGFSEAGGDDAYASLHGRRHSYHRADEMRRRDLFFARTYKGHDAPLERRTMMVPELAISYHTTPMTEGVERGTAELEKSEKDVRAMVIVTDGQPNDQKGAAIAFKKAKRAGIETYALHIEGRHASDMDTVLPPGLAWLGSVVDRVAEVKTTAEIPSAVNRLLRGVVRRGRAVT